ncbi:MAG: hypothetical protein DI540_18110 [Sphingobium sp.]|nr:MAG: hypothetical protein DI540_18110 [Sphingobium sp.]
MNVALLKERNLRYFEKWCGDDVELVHQDAELQLSQRIDAFGQQRALVIWQRLLLTDGSSLRLDNFAATDTAGYAGLADKVDFHNWYRLKGIAIATVLDVGSELTINSASDVSGAPPAADLPWKDICSRRPAAACPSI